MEIRPGSSDKGGPGHKLHDSEEINVPTQAPTLISAGIKPQGKSVRECLKDGTIFTAGDTEKYCVQVIKQVQLLYHRARWVSILTLDNVFYYEGNFSLRGLEATPSENADRAGIEDILLKLEEDFSRARELALQLYQMLIGEITNEIVMWKLDPHWTNSVVQFIMRVWMRQLEEMRESSIGHTEESRSQLYTIPWSRDKRVKRVVKIIRDARIPRDVQRLMNKLKEDSATGLDNFATYDDMGYDATSKSLYIIRKYAPCTLLDIIRNKQIPDVPSLHNIKNQLERGIALLHEMGYVHTAIAPDRVLVFENTNGEFIYKLAGLEYASAMNPKSPPTLIGEHEKGLLWYYDKSRAGQPVTAGDDMKALDNLVIVASPKRLNRDQYLELFGREPGLVKPPDRETQGSEYSKVVTGSEVLNHEQLIRKDPHTFPDLLDVIITDSRIIMHMRKYQNNLEDHCKGKKIGRENNQCLIFILMSQLVHLHQEKFLHGDIKPVNYFVVGIYDTTIARRLRPLRDKLPEPLPKLCLGDLGSALPQGSPECPKGTAGYASPEVLKQQGPVTCKTDMYSASLSILAILGYYTTFNAQTSVKELLEDLKIGCPDLAKFLELGLAYSPDKRMSAEDFVRHLLTLEYKELRREDLFSDALYQEFVNLIQLSDHELVHVSYKNTIPPQQLQLMILLSFLPHIRNLHLCIREKDGHQVLEYTKVSCNLRTAKVPLQCVRTIACQLLCSVHQLHSLGIAHCNITLDSVFIIDKDEKLTLLLGELQHAKIGGPSPTIRVRARDFSFPDPTREAVSSTEDQSFVEEMSSAAFDLWRVGQIIYFLLLGNSHLEPDDLRKLPTHPPTISSELWDVFEVVRRCFAYSTEKYHTAYNLFCYLSPSRKCT